MHDTTDSLNIEEQVATLNNIVCNSRWKHSLSVPRFDRWRNPRLLQSGIPKPGVRVHPHGNPGSEAVWASGRVGDLWPARGHEHCRVPPGSEGVTVKMPSVNEHNASSAPFYKYDHADDGYRK